MNGAVGSADQPRQPSQIERELNFLGSTIESTKQALATLYEKLQPICHAVPVKEPTASESPKESLCLIAIQIKKYRGELDLLRKAIVHFKEEIQV